MLPPVARVGKMSSGSLVAALSLALAVCAPAGPLSSVPSATPSAAVASVAASRAPTPSPTQALDPEGKSVDWATYRSDALGITFEYPRSSTTQPALPQCTPREQDRAIFLDRLDTNGEAAMALPPGMPATADAVADNYVRRVNLDTRDPTTVGGRPGVIVSYHSGGLNRFGLAVFVANGGHVYQFAWDAGVFECTPAPGFTGPGVYGHVIRSVRFLT